MARKKLQSTIDVLLSKLPPDVVTEFLAWAKYGPSYVDIQARLNEYGHTYDALDRNGEGVALEISHSATSRWYLTRFAVGEDAQLLNQISVAFAGLDTRSAMQMALGSAVKLLQLTLPLLNEELLAKLAIESPESLLHNTMVLLKEVRTAAEMMNKIEVIKERSELELAGGYRVVAIALNMAKDKPQETILQEYLEGAVRQLETEV